MIQVIPNQAVSIWYDQDFNEINFACTQDNRTFCQLVNPTDSTQFQVRQTPLTGDEIIVNPDFDGLENWDNDGWVEFPDVGIQLNIPIGNICQTIAVEANITYQIDVEVLSNQNAKICIFPVPISGTVETWGTTCSEDEVLFGDTLTVTQFFRASDTGNLSICLLGTQEVDASELIIGSVSVLELSEPEISIQTCEGTHVSDITDILYFEDMATVRVDWTDLEQGCYRICVGGLLDTSENLLGLSLCLGTESGRAMVQENGYCIKWFG